MRTFDKVRLDTAAQLTLETGYALGWAPDSDTYLTKLDGWINPAPLRVKSAPLLGGHGTHAERGWRDERIIVAGGHHVAASRGAAARYADALSAYLGDGQGGLFRVQDPDLGERWTRVFLAPGGADVVWTGGVDVSFTLYLRAPDPRKYGATIYSPPTGVPVGGAGLVFPLYGAPATGVLDIGRGGYPGRTSLINTGTAPAGPVFTVTGTNVPGFTITEVATGRRLVYTDTVELGQTLVLDSNDGTVTLDGYSPRANKLTVGDWTMVPPGAEASWGFESPGSVDALLSVAVTPAWW